MKKSNGRNISKSDFDDLKSELENLKLAPELLRAKQILGYTLDSCDHLLKVYNDACKRRGSGKPKDEEQDVLRAMFLFACAGVDSCLQQAGRDFLPTFAKEGVWIPPQTVINYASSELVDKSGKVDAVLLAHLFLSASPRKELLDTIANSLTGKGHSLQSFEAIINVFDNVGLQSSFWKDKKHDIQKAFNVRNSIVHNMDVKFTEGRKPNRINRKKEEMLDYSTLVLSIGLDFVKQAASKLVAKERNYD